MRNKTFDRGVLMVWLSFAMLTGIFLMNPEPASGKDLLIAGSRDNYIYVIDGTTDEIIKTIELSGRGFPFKIATDPAGKKIYVLTNRWESVAIVDIEQGKQLDRIDLSSPGERVKAIEIAVNRTGEKLYIYEAPVGLELDRLKVLPTRIREIDLATKKSIRTFEVPRQVSIMYFSTDGKRLYAQGPDIYVIDPDQGKVIDTIPLKNIGITGLGEVDVLNFWPHYEQTNIVSNVWSAPDTIKGNFVVGITNLDLSNGNTEWMELEAFSNIIFSSVISPTEKKAYLIYTTLSKVDLDKKRIEERVTLDHTYYCGNISSDGKKLYLGGTQRDIAIYDTATLKQVKKILLKGDQSISSLKIIKAP
jgi:quinohemoprotein amine dehydrogenase beta subunit